MAFELEKLLTDIVNNKSLQAIFNNPVYTALIIVSMVLCIIYITMRNDIDIIEDSDASMVSLMFTSAIYSILAILGVMYLQHRSVTAYFEHKYNVRAQDEIVDVTTGQGEVANLDVFNPKPTLYDKDFEESLQAEESTEDNHNTSATSKHDSSEVKVKGAVQKSVKAKKKRQQEDDDEPL